MDTDPQTSTPVGPEVAPMYFSTGEVSVLSRLEADGKTAHAGQLVRLIDIPIEGGIITDTGPATPAEHADRLKASCSRYFGSAGPALLRTLEAEYESVAKLIGTTRTKVADYAKTLTPKDAMPELRRAVKRFALTMTAGEMGIRLGVLECEMAHVEAAVQTALRAWLTDSAQMPDRLRGVMNVVGFIHRHASRFQSLSDDRHTAIPRCEPACNIDQFQGFTPITGQSWTPIDSRSSSIGFPLPSSSLSAAASM